jgi:hypothetical protein
MAYGEPDEAEKVSACVHRHCPDHACLGAEPPLIERVREWGRSRRLDEPGQLGATGNARIAMYPWPKLPG